MTLIVDGYAQTSSNLDDQLDQIGKEVQVAMAGDIDINNLVKDSYLSSVDISYSGEAPVRLELLDTTIQCFIAMPRMHLTHHYKLIMKMFYTGTDPIDVHPSKVDEMKQRLVNQTASRGKTVIFQ